MPRHKVLAQFVGSAYQSAQIKPLSPPVAIFLGRSNVGKSSLINALTKKTIAKVSKNPGKTRSINYFIYGEKLNLIDLPGYGYAKRSKAERNEWKDLVGHFFSQLPSGALAYLLMDSCRDLEEEEFNLIEALIAAQHFIVLLLTKVDRLKQSERKKRINRLKKQLLDEKLEDTLKWCFISSKTAEGIYQLQKDLYYYEKNQNLPPSLHEAQRYP